MSADAGAAPTQQNSNDSPTMEAGTTVSTSRLGANVSKDLRRSPRTSQGSGAAKVKASGSRNSLGQRSVPEKQGGQQVREAQIGKGSKKAVSGRRGPKKRIDGHVAKPSKRTTAKLGPKSKRTQGNKANAVSSFSNIFAAYRMPKTISTMELKPSNYDALAPQEDDGDVAGGDPATKPKSKSKPKPKPHVSEAPSSKGNSKGEMSQDVSAMDQVDNPVVNAAEDKLSKKKNVNTKPITKKKTGKVAQKAKLVAKGRPGKKEKATKGAQKPKPVAKKLKATHAVRKSKQSVKPPTDREKAVIKRIKSLLPPSHKKKGQGTKPFASGKRKVAASKVVKRKKTAT
ncbi:hypothetical protein RvY_16241-2 [Ramazzottius varieornatus]|nr:hypothetical protein RvY_16241-2 [Ramazzottius varieornatus]